MRNICCTSFTHSHNLYSILHTLTTEDVGCLQSSGTVTELLCIAARADFNILSLQNFQLNVMQPWQSLMQPL